MFFVYDKGNGDQSPTLGEVVKNIPLEDAQRTRILQVIKDQEKSFRRNEISVEIIGAAQKAFRRNAIFKTEKISA